jgi:hypothetical protein
VSGAFWESDEAEQEATPEQQEAHKQLLEDMNSELESQVRHTIVITTAQHSTKQYRMKQYGAVQYSTVQCHTVQCIGAHGINPLAHDSLSGCGCGRILLLRIQVKQWVG